jgi:hypothetical protein
VYVLQRCTHLELGFVLLAGGARALRGAALQMKLELNVSAVLGGGVF